MKSLILRFVPAFGWLALGGLATLPPAAAQTVTKKPAPAAGSARTLSTQRLKTLALEMMMYTQDNNAYPPMKTPAAVKKALAPYGKASSASVFLEPGANKPYLPNPNLSGVRTALVKHPADVLAFYEAAPAADGSRLICTADGRVLTLPGSKWAQAKSIFHLP